MAVLGAGKDQAGIGRVHAEGPEGGVGGCVLNRWSPGSSAVCRTVDPAARAGRGVADGDQQRIGLVQHRLHGARVVHAVKARPRSFARPGDAAIGAGVDRVDGEHQVGFGVGRTGRQDAERVDVGAGDAALLMVHALPGVAQVAAAPGAPLLDAEPDVAAVIGVEADRQDARPVHAAAELGDLDGQALPGLARIGRAEHHRARRRARAGQHVPGVVWIDGQGPYRHAVGRRAQTLEVRTAIRGQANAGVRPGKHAGRVLRVHRQGPHHAVELDGLLQAQAVPGGPIVHAAQDALPRGAYQDGSLHVECPLGMCSGLRRCRGCRSHEDTARDAAVHAQ